MVNRMGAACNFFTARTDRQCRRSRHPSEHQCRHRFGLPKWHPHVADHADDDRLLDQTIRDYVRPQALPIGIDLSLTLGKAVAPRGEVADLVDADGNLKLTADRLILSSFKGARGSAVLRQIRRDSRPSSPSRATTACARRTPIPISMCT